MLLNFLRKLFEKCFFNISKSQTECLKNHIKESVQASFNNYENETRKVKVNDIPMSHLNIKELANLTRVELESNCRNYSQTVYLGDSKILCRVLAKYICYVEAQDSSLAPHLCLNGYWESWITQAMISLLQPGFYCLDIGANYGYYSLIMADIVGESGHVLAVEPNPKLSRLLAKNLNMNGFNHYFNRNVKISEKAVADTIGQKVSLVVPMIPEGDLWGSATICGNSEITEGLSFDVQTITIDELTKDYPRVNFIKIDAEGAEEAIWRGMQQTIEKNSDITIILEFCCTRNYDPKIFLEDIQSKGFLLQYIDYDAQIKPLSVEECLSGRIGTHWDLILQRKS